MLVFPVNIQANRFLWKSPGERLETRKPVRPAESPRGFLFSFFLGVQKLTRWTFVHRKTEKVEAMTQGAPTQQCTRKIMAVGLCYECPVPVAVDWFWFWVGFWFSIWFWFSFWPSFSVSFSPCFSVWLSCSWLLMSNFTVMCSGAGAIAARHKLQAKGHTGRKQTLRQAGTAYTWGNWKVSAQGLRNSLKNSGATCSIFSQVVKIHCIQIEALS